MNALRHLELTRVFVVDIETVPCEKHHDDLHPERQALWRSFCASRHARDLAEGKTHPELFAGAGLYAEFGKVVCISVGYFRPLADETLEFRVKSFADDDEHEVLRGFAGLLGERAPHGSKLPGSTMQRDKGHFLCAHNGREFDYAYLGRRMVICGVPLPPMLNIAAYKPWDLPHLLDTMDLWKFGDTKGYISLALLAGLFGIPSPKDDLNGAGVGSTYWHDRNLGRIVTYCQKDVETTARVLLHFNGQQALWPEVRVTHTPWPAVMPAPLLRVA